MKQLFQCVPVVALAACAGQDMAQPPSDFVPDARPVATSYFYECGDLDAMTRVGPGEMALWLEDRYLVLPQVRAASGTKYAEGDVVFWSKGQDVMLEVDGVHYRDCKLNQLRVPWEDARRRGVSYRAIGTEPGWVVEIREGGTILFKGDYGATVLLFPEAQQHEQDGVRVYAAESAGHSLKVSVDDRFCSDTMADVEYPSTATVELDGRRYSGCGRHLDHPWE